MKPSQLLYRLQTKLGKGCSLGVLPSNNIEIVHIPESMESLDFDPVFIKRFSVDELMRNRIAILHSGKEFDWKSEWEFRDKSALWNFNLHYFEYLFPLVKEWKDSGDKRYIDKTVEMISGWIDNNPKGKAPGWHSYPTALRILTWISWYGYVREAIDEEFRQILLSSLHEQYVYLAGHLEKDILGNHYFEDLKSLVIAAVFFKDDTVLRKALTDFKTECREQILADGMHFELSPMYHKIVLEGMMRAAAALKGAKQQDKEIESYIKPMLDVAYSFEYGIDRTPLFNDSGNNVAKSLDGLLAAANQCFGLIPSFKTSFESSGFYIFEQNSEGRKWKLIVDAGQPGPAYIPGHAHCDAMSFELFCDGKPVIVNCGTYAYQCEERGFFRSTSAHNTVMVNETEQSQYWGIFRLAKRSSVRVLELTETSITMEMTDQKGQRARRIITISDDTLFIRDKADGHKLTSFIHNRGNCMAIKTDADVKERRNFYAEDYGLKDNITTLALSAENQIDVCIDLRLLYA